MWRDVEGWRIDLSMWAVLAIFAAPGPSGVYLTPLRRPAFASFLGGGQIGGISHDRPPTAER